MAASVDCTPVSNNFVHRKIDATQNANCNFAPIGTLKTVFLHKNGTPRQPAVCQSSRASLTVSKAVFNNPAHSLQGLHEYSHVWLIFVFHLNNNTCSKAKVKPPRLNGKKLGLYATRSPYRPVPVGLTLAKVESIEDATLHLSGVDIVDGTPVLDIKPYIPEYDAPIGLRTGITDSPLGDESSDHALVSAELDSRDQFTSSSAEEPAVASIIKTTDEIQTASWLNETDSGITEVVFGSRATEQLNEFRPRDSSIYGWSFFHTVEEAKNAIRDVLLADPRSAYRRKSCSDRLYYFTIDTMHITCWFDGPIAEILKVQPVACAQHLTANDNKHVAGR
ncbi:tRNA (adenine(37)-N6)-methyltransferase-like [Watersipora subatra]|uniref:tRNA (adenine(37)-N6)-methyltransferase-like n=1 Tax=Watersipora subatra TaxID=2589382 RepID=UPI00355BA477